MLHGYEKKANRSDRTTVVLLLSIKVPYSLAKKLPSFYLTTQVFLIYACTHHEVTLLNHS